MRKKVLLGILIILLLVSTIACSSKATTTYLVDEENRAETGYGQAPGMTNTTSAISGYKPSSDWDSSLNYADRMIVRTGNMALVVEDIQSVIEQITRIAGEHQGYVVAAQIWKEGQLLRGTISIRVLADDYDTVVRQVSTLAKEILSQTTSSQDVTEEYSDLAAQLANYEATEQQLLVIMTKAEEIDDILAVQRELSNTRNEIERIKGRMQYLERTSATSLLNIQLEQAKLMVDFNAYGTVVKVGQNMSFTAQIAGGFAPYNYEWDFGDGSTSIDIAPRHQYKKAGSYTVTLKVTDDQQNTDIKIRKDYINVQPGWSAGRIASNAWNGLVIFGRVMANILIWLGVFSPVWIIGGGIGYWIHRRRKKTKK